MIPRDPTHRNLVDDIEHRFIAMPREQLCAHLTLLGWMPVRGVLDHWIWQPESKKAVSIGRRSESNPQGTYIWHADVPFPTEEISWAQLPEEYNRLLRYVASHHAAAQLAGFV